MHRNQALSWATVLIMAVPIFGIFIPMLPRMWKSIAYEVSFYGAAPARCPGWGGPSEGLLHKGGLQTAAGDTLPLSSVLCTESTRGHLLIPTPHPMPLPLSWCLPTLPLPHMQTLSSLFLRGSLCWCPGKSADAHTEALPLTCGWCRECAPGITGVARGPQRGGAESHGDRKEGDRTPQRCTGVHVCCPRRRLSLMKTL